MQLDFMAYVFDEDLLILLLVTILFLDELYANQSLQDSTAHVPQLA